MPDSHLPLLYQTPPEWADQVLRRPLELLEDHAHLEKKAAANALELLNRWPGSSPPAHWVAALTAIARDEAEHLAAVCRLLERRGGQLTKRHSNPYAAGLRALVRQGQGTAELIDRLLVSALIEARSCERFLCLADHLSEPALALERRDPELCKLYRGLWSSEHGHYLTFLQLAEEVDEPEEVRRRWQEMLESEAQIIAEQPVGARMHSGV